MTVENDDTRKTALRLIRRHGDEVMPIIQREIDASTARADWEQVGDWCRVRLRASRLLLERERAERGGWRPIYPSPNATPSLPWTGLSGRRPRPEPSAA